MALDARTCWHSPFKIAKTAERHEHSHSNLVKLKTFLGPSWETLFDNEGAEPASVWSVSFGDTPILLFL